MFQPACWVLLQQQQSSMLLSPQHLAPLPPWITPSNQPCCSWLGTAQHSPAQPGAGQALSPRTGPLDPSSEHEQQQQQHLLLGQQQQVDGTVDVDGAPAADGPAAKRARLLDAPGMAGSAEQEPSATATAETTTSLEAALSQLQAFVQHGDTTRMDPCLCAQLLAAMARGTDAGASSSAQLVLQQAQQQLQQLSADACKVLLEELLPAFDPNGSSSSSGTAMQAPTGPVRLTPSALAHLLTHALLPKLQSLEAAAPKPLLASLTVLGRSSAQGVLADSLLSPLVLGQGLLPVQVQLLVKLAKDAVGLQPRLLDLLLVAAVGDGAAAQHFSAHPSGSRPCCWREPHASLLKHLLDMGPQHASQRLAAVVAALEAVVQHPAVASSTAFGQLVMSLLKACAAALSKQQVERLQAVVGLTSTFLTKSLTSKLQQLQQQHSAGG